MRIAVAGKGGAGKTTISATLARHAARSGRRVVAIDADANPNLGTALGMSLQQTAALSPLPGGIVSRRFGGPGLTLPVEELLERFGLLGPDGLRLALMGSPAHAGEGCLCSAHATVSALLEDLGPGSDSTVVIDMEASPEHFSRGTVRHTDAVVLIAEPYYRSLETVRRMAQLAGDLDIARLLVVANKVRGVEDAEAVREFCDRHQLELAATVPWSDAVGLADRRRSAVVDTPGTADVVQAVASVGDVLVGDAHRGDLGVHPA